MTLLLRKSSAQARIEGWDPRNRSDDEYTVPGRCESTPTVPPSNALVPNRLPSARIRSTDGQRLLQPRCSRPPDRIPPDKFTGAIDPANLVSEEGPAAALRGARPAIIADGNRHAAEHRLPHADTQIPGLEEQVLCAPQMNLAVDTDPTVRADDRAISA